MSRFDPEVRFQNQGAERICGAKLLGDRRRRDPISLKGESAALSRIYSMDPIAGEVEFLESSIFDYSSYLSVARAIVDESVPSRIVLISSKRLSAGFC
jgi:hypothetical protein